MQYILLYLTVIGNVSSSTTFDWLLIPDILHLYILKSLGHWKMSLFSVSLSCAVFNVLIEPEAVAPLLCNVLSAHKSLSSMATETTVLKVTLAFLESWMKNKEVSL